MTNEGNLKPVRSKAEARERGRIGGVKSGEARREKKLFKEEILKRMGEDDWDEMIDKLIARAKITDKAFEVLRDTIGQKPKEEISAEVENVIKVELKDD